MQNKGVEIQLTSIQCTAFNSNGQKAISFSFFLAMSFVCLYFNVSMGTTCKCFALTKERRPYSTDRSSYFKDTLGIVGYYGFKTLLLTLLCCHNISFQMLWKEVIIIAWKKPHLPLFIVFDSASATSIFEPLVSFRSRFMSKLSLLSPLLPRLLFSSSKLLLFSNGLDAERFDSEFSISSSSLFLNKKKKYRNGAMLVLMYKKYLRGKLIFKTKEAN